MRRPLILAAVIGAGLGAIAVSAQFLPQNVPVPNFGPVTRIAKMADGLYFVPGGGGNTAVFVHANGVLLVDTKVPKSGEPLLTVIRRVTDKPITQIVNTHHHFDHSGSNPEFPASVEIVAHENAAANMAKAESTQTDAGRIGLPDKTFKTRMSLLSGKDVVDLYHFGAGHTNGDTFIVFRNARVMHAGDLFAQQGGTLIDRANGGSAVAVATTIANAAAGIRNVDRVITGHASVVSWKDFLDYRDFHRLVMAHARAQLAAGKTAEQALAAFNPPAKFKDYRWGRPGAAPAGANPLQRPPAAAPPAGAPARPPGAPAAAPPAPGGMFAGIYAELKK